MLRHARQTAGLSLRVLAERADTSHSTLVAYESGRVVPRVDTLDRILRAAGFSASISLDQRADSTIEEREAKGRELVAVLDLAAQFPARHEPTIEFPPFPRTPAA